MKKLNYLICLFALVMIGCKTQKEVATLPPVVLNNADSVRVETVVKYVYAPVEIAIELPQQSETNATLNDSSHVETDLAFSDAWIKGGILYHLINNKPGQFTGTSLVPQLSEVTTKERTSVREIPIATPYPIEVERDFTIMERLKIDTFWYLLAFALLNFGYILRKPLFSIIHRFI